MLNTVPVAPGGRQPRAIVRLGGAVVSGWESWEVANNAYYEADTFRLCFAASGLPGANNPAWFASQTRLFAEVLAGFPANPSAPKASELTSLIYGRIDDIEYDPVRTVVTLTGRDLTAAFIDQKLTDEYQNQTASGIVTKLADAAGIDSAVTATTTKIGTYYANDQVRLQANRSQWDLIAWLAREEGFVAFVSPTLGLYFGPDIRDSSNPYVIRWQPPTAAGGAPVANVKEISFSRSLTVANGIAVTVRSPSTLKKSPTVASYPKAPRAIQPGKPAPFAGIQAYYFNAARDLTPVQVETLAERYYNQIIAHAMKLTAKLPADVILNISTPLRVEGTGTAFDQTYFPRLITRRMSVDEFEMDIEAQNTTPELAQAGAAL